MPTDFNQNANAVDQFLLKAIQKYQAMAGSGKQGFFGHNYVDDFTKNAGYRAQFLPAGGESQEAWIRRLDQEFPGMAHIVGKPQYSYAHAGADKIKMQSDGRVTGDTASHAGVQWGVNHVMGILKNVDRSRMSPEQIAELDRMIANQTVSPDDLDYLVKNGAFAGEAMGERSGTGVGGAGGPSGTDRMRAFGEAMMAPIDPNDPYVAQLMKTTQAMGQEDAISRGLKGGVAVGNTQKYMGRTLNDAQMQRNQLGLSALGQAEGIDMQKSQMAIDQYNQQYSQYMQQMQAQQDQRANTGRMVGGAIGTGLGAVASIFAPAAAPALISGGGALGGGIGGAVGGGGGGNYPAYMPPSSPRGGRGFY